MNRKKLDVFLLSKILVIVSGLLFAFSLGVFDFGMQEAATLSSFSSVLPPDVFSDVEVSAKSAVVFLPKENEIIFEKNKNIQLPLASITKVITTLAVLDVLDEEETINYAGDTFKVKDLLRYMLATSSNDIAKFFKDYLEKYRKVSFDELVKNVIQKLSLKQTYLLNSSGLDDSDFVSGGYGSAEDVARLVYYAVVNYPEIFEATTKPKAKLYSLDGELILEKENTNKVIGEIPGFLGGKTGYTDLARGNLAIVSEYGMGEHIVVVVLGSKDRQARFTDTIELLRRAQDWVRFNKL